MQVGIVGASIAGLSVANVLHRHGFRVKVFEAFEHGFQNRGGALGFVDIGLVDDIRGTSKSSPPSSTRRFSNQVGGGAFFYGTVWKFLYEGLPKGTVSFGAPVQSLRDADSKQPKIVLEDNSIHTFDFVVGADGGRSVVRSHVVGDKHSEAKYSGYTVYRGLVPGSEIDHAPRGDADHGKYHYTTLGFPCRNEKGEVLWNCGVYMPLLIKYVTKSLSRNRQVSDNTKSVPDWFLPLMKRLFPNKKAVKFWSVCVEKGKVTQHPVFEFGANKVTQNHLLIVGDAAHMISPRTGSGAYSAMLDAMALDDVLERTGSRTNGDEPADLEQALHEYAEDGCNRAQQFYRHSLSKKREFMPLHEFDSPSPEDLLQDSVEVQTNNFFW